jgi:hypothetical protein
MGRAVISMTYVFRQRARRDMVSLTDRLIAEYSEVVPAEVVKRCVSDAHEELARQPDETVDFVGAAEQLARYQLDARVPAHRTF